MVGSPTYHGREQRPLDRPHRKLMMTSDRRSPDVPATERDRLAAVLELLVHAVGETVPRDEWHGALRIAYDQACTLVFSDGSDFEPDRLRRAHDLLCSRHPSDRP